MEDLKGIKSFFIAIGYVCIGGILFSIIKSISNHTIAVVLMLIVSVFVIDNKLKEFRENE